MPPVITDSNQEILTAIAEAIHTMSHDVHAMAADIRALRKAWDDHGAVVRGFQAGGLLGARAARKGG